MLKHVKLTAISTCIFLFWSSSLKAQEYNYPASDIQDSLKSNAVAVIRDHTSTFIQTDINHATYKAHYVTTILSKQGDGYAYFFTVGDNFRELSNFSAVIRNAKGDVIKKVKKSDLLTSSFDNQNLASDSYSISYIFQSPTYPFTIEYTYEEKWKNGIINYPSFYPFLGYKQSVEKAKFEIEVPSSIQLRHLANYEANLLEQTNGSKTTYSTEYTNIKAIKDEPLSPRSQTTLPKIMLAPSEFCFDGACGNMATWEGYGNWLLDLLEDREDITAALAQKISEITADKKTDREKVKAIYEYLQQNTRYVSIQLGIGGFQPIYASEVSKTGFGDCKGLSNLMKTMLNHVGIKSYYCEISSGKDRDLYKDFANVNQTNHAIVLVPLEKDSIWLECTSQTLPFGYVHSNIAGYDAMVVTEKGGIIRKLPSYADELNNSSTTLEIKVKEDGEAEGTVMFNEKVRSYEGAYMTFRSNDRDKQISYINSYLKMPQIQINNISTNEDKSELPSTQLKADYQAKNFANTNGNRMFIPLCPINKGNYNVFTSAERTLDIYIPYGYSETDTIYIDIPDGMTVEHLPKEINLENEFGSLKTVASQDGNKITYIQNINIHAGTYNKDLYKEIKGFYGEISSAIKRKLVIKKI